MTEEQILAIYRDTIDPLYGFVSRSCDGDRQLAEDVTQETWMRAVRQWRENGPPEKPLAWLTTVARNLLLNHFRSRRTVSLEDAPLDALRAAEDPDADGEGADRVRTLTLAINRLPVGQAGLLRAFHFDRRRMADLAAAIGITERAVEGRLRRARERLRAELESSLLNRGNHDE